VEEELRDPSVHTLGEVGGSLADARKTLDPVGEGSSLSKSQKVMLRVTGGWPG
jgi:hypothetical protein